MKMAKQPRLYDIEGWQQYILDELKEELEEECGTKDHPKKDELFKAALDSCEGSSAALADLYRRFLEEKNGN